jgi:hypothetical protein
MCFPNYLNLTHRLRSFENWPHKNKNNLLPVEMSNAGFFYTGQGDLVACHRCGIGVENWGHMDAPANVHRRLKERCACCTPTSDS